LEEGGAPLKLLFLVTLVVLAVEELETLLQQIDLLVLEQLLKALLVV
jgi:hypothetical protein